MAADEDEDVVFENSALHQHLKSAGIDDIETVPHASANSEFHDIKTEQKSDFYPICSVRMAVAELFQFVRLKTTLRKMESLTKNSIYMDLRKCKTLEPDDALFLEEYLGYSDTSSLQDNSRLTGLFAVCAIMLAVLIHRILQTKLSWQQLIFTDPVVILAICCGMLLAGCILFLTIKKMKLQEQANVLKSFLRDLEEFQLTMKKSIRLIQECELVARGFTLVTSTGPLSMLEQSSLQKTSRQCPELRRCLFHVSRDSMMYLRNATQLLVQKYFPVSPGDFVSNYLAHIPLEDYGPCIQIVGNSSESRKKLMEVTDNFSVSALKAMSNLWNLQQSEFIRCLAVCFQSLSVWPNNRAQAVSIQRILSAVLKPPMVMLEDERDKLKQCYEFHRASTLEKETSRPVLLKNETSPLKNLYVAIHSLDLHLQSALRMSRSLATEIESREEAGGGDSLDPVGNLWSEQLQRIKAELAACQGCWDEGQGQAERLLKVKPPVAEHPVQEQSPCTKAASSLKPTIKIIGDPVIEDEVFEAYIDTDEEETESAAWDEFLSPEEKAKKKREKEEALRLLSELKTVISGIAEERKKKEEKILSAKLGRTATEQPKSDDSLVEDGHIGLVPEPNTGSCPVSEIEGDLSLNPIEGDGVLVSRNQEVSTGPSIETRTERRINSSNSDFSDLTGRLEKLSGANLSFTATIAAQAVAKSKLLGLEADTFGDESDDSSGEDTTET